MIDLHNHVLYGVDDGAQTLEDSLEMIQAAADVGFTELMLTPHYMCYQGYVSPASENAKRLAVLQEAVARAGIQMTLHLGNELLYDFKLNSLMGTGILNPMGDTGYFLVETIRYGGSSLLLEQFRRRLKNAGYGMILAHPERYDFVQDNPNVLLDFIASGCLVQVNYLSLIDYYRPPARETLEIMLAHGMVQLMGSDAHQKEGYALYHKAEARGIALLGEKRWHRIMCDNPMKLLKKEKILPEGLKPYRPAARKSVIARTAL